MLVIAATIFTGSIMFSSTHEETEVFSQSDVAIMKQYPETFKKIVMRKSGKDSAYIRHFGYWKTEANGSRRLIKLSELKRKAASH
ncbi:hypothetical protein [Peribacillus frigoritolerans]|uniref:Uncharacterized protein n=1 Tax=Peribacillus frigoritolerans TaxID=450367 RepID=A0AAJ1QKC6_9BACI|nr:hypothetical protein [Peribacillus frigoritolerans]MDM5283104.1 hypothetical protein [Peribacillus frigoritolerans]